MGYLDTKQKIIETLTGRVAGTQIQPSEHQEFALSLLEYIRSVELISGSTLIGIAERNTVPVQPDTANACYIAGCPKGESIQFENFHDENGNPVSIDGNDSIAYVIILLWNRQYWSAVSIESTFVINSTMEDMEKFLVDATTTINKNREDALSDISTERKDSLDEINNTAAEQKQILENIGGKAENVTYSGNIDGDNVKDALNNAGTKLSTQDTEIAELKDVVKGFVKMSDGLFVQGYLKTDGTEVTDNKDWKYTKEYIPVEVGDKYKMNSLSTGTVYMFAAYDSEYNLIPDKSIDYNGAVKKVLFTFEATEGVSFIRITHHNDYDGVFVQTANNNRIQTLEDRAEVLEEKVAANTKDISVNSDRTTKISEHVYGSSTFNNDDCINKDTLLLYDGTTKSFSGAYVSDFINVKGYLALVFDGYYDPSKAYAGLALYEEDKETVIYRNTAQVVSLDMSEYPTASWAKICTVPVMKATSELKLGDGTPGIDDDIKTMKTDIEKLKPVETNIVNGWTYIDPEGETIETDNSHTSAISPLPNNESNMYFSRSNAINADGYLISRVRGKFSSTDVTIYLYDVAQAKVVASYPITISAIGIVDEDISAFNIQISGNYLVTATNVYYDTKGNSIRIQNGVITNVSDIVAPSCAFVFLKGSKMMGLKELEDNIGKIDDISNRIDKIAGFKQLGTYGYAPNIVPNKNTSTTNGYWMTMLNSATTESGFLKEITFYACKTETVQFAIGVYDQHGYFVATSFFNLNPSKVGRITMDVYDQYIPIQAGQQLFVSQQSAEGNTGIIGYAGTFKTDEAYKHNLVYNIKPGGTGETFPTSMGALNTVLEYSLFTLESMFALQAQLDEANEKIETLQKNKFIYDADGNPYTMRVNSDGTIVALASVFKKVLVLGNSLTWHERWGGNGDGKPTTSNWSGLNRSMASTTDDVSWPFLFQRIIRNKISDAQVTGVMMRNWENTAQGSRDITKIPSTKALLDAAITEDTDLIIFRTGENGSVSDSDIYADEIKMLLDYCLDIAPRAQVVMTTLFWASSVKDNAIKKVASERGYQLVTAGSTFSKYAEHNGDFHVDSNDPNSWLLLSPSVLSHTADHGFYLWTNYIATQLGYGDFVLDELRHITVESSLAGGYYLKDTESPYKSLVTVLTYETEQPNCSVVDAYENDIEVRVFNITDAKISNQTFAFCFIQPNSDVTVTLS